MTLLSASPGSLRKRAEEDRATKGAALNLLVAERAAARQEAGALGEALAARKVDHAKKMRTIAEGRATLQSTGGSENADIVAGLAQSFDQAEQDERAEFSRQVASREALLRVAEERLRAVGGKYEATLQELEAAKAVATGALGADASAALQTEVRGLRERCDRVTAAFDAATLYLTRTMGGLKEVRAGLAASTYRRLVAGDKVDKKTTAEDAFLAAVTAEDRGMLALAAQIPAFVQADASAPAPLSEKSMPPTEADEEGATGATGATGAADATGATGPAVLEEQAAPSAASTPQLKAIAARRAAKSAKSAKAAVVAQKAQKRAEKAVAKAAAATAAATNAAAAARDA